MTSSAMKIKTKGNNDMQEKQAAIKIQSWKEPWISFNSVFSHVLLSGKTFFKQKPY